MRGVRRQVFAKSTKPIPPVQVGKGPTAGSLLSTAANNTRHFVRESQSYGQGGPICSVRQCLKAIQDGTLR